MHEHDSQLSDVLRPARQLVHDFFDQVPRLSSDDVAVLRREHRKAGGRLARTTDPDFLHAVSAGVWSRAHHDAARDIRAEARARAATLVPWPRRGAVADALEDAALVVLSEADPQRPLSDRLCARLAGPWERATGRQLRPADW